MSRGPYSSPRPDNRLRIRFKRIEAGLTQEQLAEAVETSQATVARWERGEVDLSVKKLLEIAEALGCAPSELIDNGDGLSDHERDHIRFMRDNPRERKIIEATVQALREPD